MRAKNPWLKLVQIVMVAVAIGAGGCCLFIFLDFAHGGWPRRPFGRFRPAADLLAGFGAIALVAAGMLTNALRIGRGEGFGRFLAALVGAGAALAALVGAGAALAALVAVGSLVSIAQTFYETPISSKLTTLLFLACLLPFLSLLAVVAFAGLELCFAERPPSLAGLVRLLIATLPVAAATASVMSLIAVARQRDLGDALWVAAPTVLGLVALTAVLAMRARGGTAGWALARAVAGYAGGAFAVLVLSAFLESVATTSDPRAAFFNVIVFAPLALAAAALFGFALLLASGRVAVGFARIRRALA